MSIMIDLVTGKTVPHAQTLVTDYLSMVRGASLSEASLEALEDAQAFSGLSKMPARVKCGTIGWHCLGVILEKVAK